MSPTPGNVDIAAVVSDLRDDHVHAPADQVPALQEIVTHADSQGYDINLVVLPEARPGMFTVYRDIATAVQNELDESEGTVLVIGPNASGTSSLDFPRDTLEKATENVSLADPPVAAQQIVDEILAPGPDWTLLTIVIILGVAVAAVLARFAALRSRIWGANAADAEITVADRTGDAAGNSHSPNPDAAKFGTPHAADSATSAHRDD